MRQLDVGLLQTDVVTTCDITSVWQHQYFVIVECFNLKWKLEIDIHQILQRGNIFVEQKLLILELIAKIFEVDQHSVVNILRNELVVFQHTVDLRRLFQIGNILRQPSQIILQ